MTATLNKVQLIGNIGAEPKTITTKEGNPFVTVSFATNEAVKRNGEWVSMVEWHQLLFFGSMTKITEYLHKGNQAYIEGKLRSNSWTDTAGSSHRTTNIVVTNVQLLSHPKSKDGSTESVSIDADADELHHMSEISSEEIPF